MAIWELAPGSPWNAIFMAFVIFSVLAGLVSAAQAFPIAFSSEVDAGSREENTSKQKDKSSFNQNEALVSGGRFRDRLVYRRRAARCRRCRCRFACRLPAPAIAPVFPAFPARRGAG